MPRRSTLLLVLSSIIFFMGCLKEGEIQPSDKTMKLAIVPSATEINAGDTIDFDIILLDEIVAADLMINDIKVPGTEFRFMEGGVYSVFAQMDGVENSDTITINVTDKGKLVLVPSKAIINVGDEVSFDILLDNEPVQNADIYVGGNKIDGNTYVFNDPGEYKTYAKKEGFKTSDTVKIFVTRKDKILLSVTSTDVQVGESVSFATTVNGEPLLETSIFVDGIKLTTNTIVFNEVGTHKAYATKEGYETSDTVIINVIQVKLPKISLTAFPDEVRVGQQVSLSPTGKDGIQLKNAKVYVGDQLVATTLSGGFPFVWNATAPGKYLAYATAAGYETSDTIKITVIKVPKLKLSAKPVEATTPDGSKVYSFEVTSDGEIVTGASLYKDGVKQSGLDNISFKPRSNPYAVFATKSGYDNSDTLSLLIQDDRPQIVLEASQTEVTAGTTVSFSAWIPIAGDMMTIDAQFYIDGNLISGQNYTFNTPGTYQVVAKGLGGMYKDSEPVKITVIQTNAGINVYVGGTMGVGRNYFATYWTDKGGILAGGEALHYNGLQDGHARGIFARNDTIYVAGNITLYPSTDKTGRLHKLFMRNGQYLDVISNGINEIEEVYGMAEKGDDLIILGTKESQIGYSTNGTTFTQLSNSDIGSIEPVSIKIDHNDIYALGSSTGFTDNRSYYWKNTASGMVEIQGDGESTGVQAYGMDVKNGVVYITGVLKKGDFFNTETKAAYWVNGVRTDLSDYASGGLGVLDIAVSGNGDVYILGSVSGTTPTSNKIVVWKNGRSHQIDLTDGTTLVQAVKMQIASNGDIYVAGSKSFPQYTFQHAVYWKIDTKGQVTEVLLTEEDTRGSFPESLYIQEN